MLETFPLVLERLVYKTLEAQNQTLGPRKATLKGQINPNADYITATAFIPVQPILHRIDIHHETQENIRKQTVQTAVLQIETRELIAYQFFSFINSWNWTNCGSDLKSCNVGYKKKLKMNRKRFWCCKSKRITIT